MHFVSEGPIDDVILVQVMAWGWRGDKPITWTNDDQVYYRRVSFRCANKYVSSILYIYLYLYIYILYLYIYVIYRPGGMVELI